uniref:Uncharacterized protein n=1 Tax=Hyaloperonospora arabidopsidis (strain Emoy2) TaxID=559515 RepID=M4BXP5_HYAAE
MIAFRQCQIVKRVTSFFNRKNSSLVIWLRSSTFLLRREVTICRGRSSSVPSRIQMKHTNVLAPEKLILSKSVLNPQFQINNLLCPPPRQSLHHNLKTIGPRNHLTRRKSRSGVTLPTSRSWIQIKLCWLCLVYSEGSS